MTKKTHPYGFRLGITKNWKSNWFALTKDKYREIVKSDFKIREFLEKELDAKMVSDIILERQEDKLIIIIKSARPGFILGKEGQGIKELTDKLNKFIKKYNLIPSVINIKIEEVRYVETSAVLIAEQIVGSLKKRIQHRKIMKQMVDKVMSNRNVKGVRITIGGRLGGAEIARSEEVKKGTIPLQTLRADIDYTHKEAILPYGTLGIKVWVYLGEKNN